MDLGAFYFPTHYGIEVAELARELEDRGFESLFVCEHTHIPLSRKTPFPAGGELPERYKHTLDPFVALSFAAGATKTLRLGTGICLLAQRDAIVTAKCAASLDLLSGGRFVFGVGAGWNQDEMENHGVAYKTRFRVMSEKVKAVKALWQQEEAAFHGEFVDFDPVWCSPKPHQRPNPPILLGGESEHTLKRIVEYADGWLPRADRNFEPERDMGRLRAAAEQAGRPAAELSVTVFRAPTERDALARYADAGIGRGLFDVPDEPRDTVLPLLDEYAKLVP